MKTEVLVVEPVENEVPEQEQLRIRKVTVGSFEGQTTVEYNGSLLHCGTCANTGCSTYLICTDTCLTTM
jgi:hypothetical protein